MNCEKCKKQLNNYEYFLSSHNICDKCRAKIWKDQGLLNDQYRRVNNNDRFYNRVTGGYCRHIKRGKILQNDKRI